MPHGGTTVYDRGTQLCRTQDLSEHPTSTLARMCLLMIMTSGRSRQLPGEPCSAARKSLRTDTHAALQGWCNLSWLRSGAARACLTLLIAGGASLRAALDLLIRLDGLRYQRQRCTPLAKMWRHWFAHGTQSCTYSMTPRCMHSTTGGAGVLCAPS